MKFPLPVGHFFGLNPYDVKSHDGNDNWADEANLRHWQRTYQLRWDREAPITGRFDGPAQRAVVRVQHEYGLPVTAVLDMDTWEAGLRGPRATQSAEHDVPVVESTPETGSAPEGVSGLSGPNGTDHTSGASNHPDLGSAQLLRAAEETVPAWFDPAKGPVGQGSTGHTVRKIRSILGLQPRDTWSKEVTERIRGLQKLHSLPVTGWVDTQTARILDMRAAKK